MLLETNQPIGFIPTANAEAARSFYEHTLGLHFESDDQFALVFRLGPARGTMLRVVRAGTFTPAPFTIFGWETGSIETCVDELARNGVEFLRFSYFEQDERGIWSSPGGARVAWFKDPDGNTLSLSQHPD
ncbi:MAG TPA: VOC family protein [Acidobacteriaceae bacterium]|nr:VOC family protein [Acidobacteriaceae bacterium]